MLSLKHFTGNRRAGFTLIQLLLDKNKYKKTLDFFLFNELIFSNFVHLKNMEEHKVSAHFPFIPYFDTFSDQI